MRKTTGVLASSLFISVSSCVLAGTNGLDATFGSGGILRVPPVPVGIGLSLNRIQLYALSNGGFLVSGYVWGSWDPVPRAAIGRLQANGEWDMTFGDNGLFVLPANAASAPYGSEIEAVTTFSTGEILAAGVSLQSGSDINYNTCILLIKLTSGGAVDKTFGPNQTGSFCFDFAPPPPDAYRMSLWDDIRVDDDDTFFLTSTSTNLSQNAVARFDASGALVSSYGTNGIAMLPNGLYGGRMQLLAQHHVVVAGVVVAENSEFAGASVVDALGNVDLSYGINGVASLDEQTDPSGLSMIHAAIDASGRLLLASIGITGADISGYHLERFDATGAGDSTFNGNHQQSGSPGVAVLSLRSPSTYLDEIEGTVPMLDGHLIVVGSVGYAASGDGTGNVALMRLNDDASYDSSFGQDAHPGWTALNAGGLDDSMNAPSALTTDVSGRILIAFNGSDPAGGSCLGILRVIPDRLLDASFDAAAPLPTCPQ